MTTAISYLQELNVLQPEQMAKVIQLIYPKMKRGIPFNEKGDIIIKTVCNYFGVEEKEIAKRCRKRQVAEVRHIVYYFCCLYKIATLKNIGSVVSGRQDHTTVLHARNKVQGYIDVEPDFKLKMIEIKNLLDNQIKVTLYEPTI